MVNRISFYDFIRRLDEASGNDIATVITQLYNSNDLEAFSVIPVHTNKKLDHRFNQSTDLLKLHSDYDKDYIVVRITKDNLFITMMKVKNSEGELKAYYIVKTAEE